MAREIQELEFRLLDKVSQGLAGISKSFTGLKANVVALNQGFELAGKGLGLFVGAAKGLGDAAAGVIDFETAMARISTVTNATAEDQVALQTAVENAVNTLGVSAGDAAGVLLKLAEDGASAGEAIGSMGQVIAYAQANFKSASEAAVGLGGALDSFGEKQAVVGQLVDALTAVARAAGTSTQALEKGLSGVGDAAQQSGLSITQTVALLGQLATRNIEGGDASKRLAGILTDFKNPASEAGKALESVGLGGADLTKILDTLSRDATSATTVLQSLGRKPAEALRALLADGGGALKSLNKIVGESEGSAKKAADALSKTFARSLEAVTSKLDLLKIELLTPFLDPLAKGLQALSAELTAFAKSPEFDLLVTQFTKLSADGLKAIGELVKGFDLRATAESVAQFATDIIRNLDAISGAIQTAGNAAGGFSDGAVATFESARSAIAASLSSTLAAFGAFNVEAANLSVSLAAIAEDARRNAGDALGRLAKRLEDTGVQAEKAAKGIDKAAFASADVSVGVLKTVPHLTLFGNALDETGTKGEFAASRFNMVAGAAEKAGEAISDTSAVVSEAALNLARLDLARLNSKFAEMFAAGKQGTEEFRNLSAQVLAASANVDRLSTAFTEAAKKAKDLGGSTDDAATSVTDFGQASKVAAEAVETLSKKNSQVDESFSTIDGAISEVTLSLDGLNAAAFQFAGQTGKNLIDSLNRTTNAALEQRDAFQRRLEQTRESLALHDEEAQALERLGGQYRLLDKESLRPLLEAERQLLDIRNKRADANKRVVDSENEVAAATRGQAGGLGTGAPRPAQPQNGEAATVAAAAAGAVTIIIQGRASEDQEELAATVARQLARQQRLSR